MMIPAEAPKSGQTIADRSLVNGRFLAANKFHGNRKEFIILAISPSMPLTAN